MSDDLSRYPEEKRFIADRRIKARDAGERRQMAHGVQFTFSGSLEAVEDWLEDNCDGDFRIVIVGMTDDLKRKTIELMFANADDRERFKASADQF